MSVAPNFWLWTPGGPYKIEKHELLESRDAKIIGVLNQFIQSQTSFSPWSEREQMELLLKMKLSAQPSFSLSEDVFWKICDPFKGIDRVPKEALNQFASALGFELIWQGDRLCRCQPLLPDLAKLRIQDESTK